MSARAAPRSDLADVVDTAGIIVCTGSGGVGKTSTAAALGLAAARAGRRTVVATIDPARRLAQSLGLSELDAAPRELDAEGTDGNLHAMMLDMKRTFDQVVERHAGSAERTRRITTNRFYQQLSSSLAGTQEYMAMEQLHELHSSGAWDCIVVDTPPTRSALDFLDAPRRLTDFLDGRFLRMFLTPGLSAGRSVGKAVGFGAGLFMKAASKVTGAGVLEDLGEFFQAFDGMYEGFKQRALDVYKLLGSPESAFVVVAAPEPPALREARFFLQRLEQDGMPTAGLVVNRVVVAPPELTAVTDAALTALDEGDEAAQLSAALLRLAADRRAVAAREHRAVRAALHGLELPAVVEVPRLPGDVHDLDGLTALGRHLTGR